MIYKKVFRDPFFENNNVEVTAVNYPFEEVPYFTFIKEQKQHDRKQVIISSDLMIKILENTILSNGDILKVSLNNQTDEAFVDEVEKKVRELQLGTTNINELISLFSIFIENQSLDIKEAKIKFNDQVVRITSEGVLIGNKPFDKIDSEIILPTIKEVLNNGRLD